MKIAKKKNYKKLSAVFVTVPTLCIVGDKMQGRLVRCILEIVSESVRHLGIFGIMQIWLLFASCILHARYRRFQIHPENGFSVKKETENMFDTH